MNSTSLTAYAETEFSRWFRLVTFSLVIVFSLIGNAVVVKAIRKNPHTKKPFTYFLVTNLAVAELLGTVCLPFFQIYDELLTWPFGDAMCPLVSALMIMSYFVIPWSLAAISFLRFKAFAKVRLISVSGKRVGIFISILWICGTVISAPTYIFAVRVKTVYDNVSYWCIELFPGDSLETFPSPSLWRYYFIRFVLNFVLPGIVIMVAYGGVAMKLKRHLTQLSVTRNNSDEPDPYTLSTFQTTASSEELEEAPAAVEEVPQPTEENARRAENDHRTSWEQLEEMEMDLLRMIYIVILVYIGCYLPYQVLFLLEYFGPSSWRMWRYYLVTRKYVYLLTCFPGALHPVCYGTMSTFYARIFSRLILCKKNTQH